ncbi:MAG: glycosyltransferase [Anaerolineales bacterium]
MMNGHSSPWPPEYRRNLKRKGSYRFAVLNWGTRGDIQPFVALGSELVERGHQVVMAARAPYRALAEARGIEYFAMEEDGTVDLMRSLAASKNLPEMLSASTSYSRRIARQQLQSFWDASRGADVILTKVITTAPAMHVAEARGLPVFLAHFDPGFIPTESYCFADGLIRDKGGFFNRFMSGLMLLSFGLFLSDKINAWRRERGMRLDPLVLRNWAPHLSRFPAFAAWSGHFLPRPPDWPERTVQTGWWSLPQKTPVDPRLQGFIQSGPPPVYIGFGSWGVHEKTAVTEVLLEALRLTGNRAVLLGNTVDDRPKFPDTVLVADELPHDWLLPRMKAAVHHGGAGTVGAAITAGIPSVVVPSFGMQAAWGRMIAEKKIGSFLEKQAMSAERLAAALREVDRPEIRERARALGALARTDGGAIQAADEIERRLWEATSGSALRAVPALAYVRPTDTSRETLARLPSPDSPEREEIADGEWTPEIPQERK